MLAACVVLIANCTKPTLIGTDLLEDEKAELLFLDDFDLSFTTVRQDSIQTYGELVADQLINYMCGEINDPIFGTYSSEIYTQMSLDFNTNPLNLFESQIDSIVMTLQYDTMGLYGDVGKPIDIEILLMQELMTLEDDIYSSDTFAVLESAPLAQITGFIPKPMDSVILVVDTNMTALVPHLRVPLNISMFDPIFDAKDTTALLNQDTLTANYFNGFNIRITEANNSMYGFRLNSDLSGITVHYTKDSTQSVQKFGFEFNIAKTVHFEHDYSGSIVEPFIDNTELGDSLIFVQSLSGVNSVMNVGGLDSLGSALINHAEVQFYTAELPEDNLDLYPKVNQLITMQKDEDGALELSEDAFLALASSALQVAFGGEIEAMDMSGISRYKMNVTGQLQDIFRGDRENAIYLTPFLKANLPDRVVIFGADHPEFAPRLRVAYTRVK